MLTLWSSWRSRASKNFNYQCKGRDSAEAQCKNKKTCKIETYRNKKSQEVECQVQALFLVILADLLKLLPFCFWRTLKVLNCFLGFIICRLIGLWSPAELCHQDVMGRSTCIIILFSFGLQRELTPEIYWNMFEARVRTVWITATKWLKIVLKKLLCTDKKPLFLGQQRLIVGQSRTWSVGSWVAKVMDSTMSLAQGHKPEGKWIWAAGEKFWQRLFGSLFFPIIPSTLQLLEIQNIPQAIRYYSLCLSYYIFSLYPFPHFYFSYPNQFFEVFLAAIFHCCHQNFNVVYCLFYPLFAFSHTPPQTSSELVPTEYQCAQMVQ